MIEVKDIYKTFGDNEVLRGITSTFRPGKNNLIIGGSGSGKTTLLKCIVGLHEPTKGDVLYDGHNFTDMHFTDRVHIRKEIGMLFQNSALFDSMTVEENIMFPLNLFTDQSREEKLDRANFCLKRVNLEGKNKLYPSELSGGMKKRVGIARAISMQPKYLFVDEPNSGLDPLTSILIDDCGADRGILYYHGGGYARYELSNGYRRSYYIPLQRPKMVGRHQSRHCPRRQ